MPNDNFLGIEDSFSEAGRVNDLLFNDTDPNDLEEIEKKKKADADKALADKKKAEEEAKKKAAGIKQEPKKEETPKEDELDATDSIFGKAEEEDKEEEPKEEDEEKKDTPEGEEPKEDETNQFAILSKELYKIGIFAPDVNEEGEEITHTASTPEEFKKLFEYQQQTGMYAMLDNHLGRFGQDRLELFDAIFTKGVDPKEYLPVYNEIESFKELSLDTETAQERVVRESLKRSGLSDASIEKQVQKLKDISELQNTAEELKVVLISQDEKALKDQEEQAEAKTKAEAAKDVQYKASIAKILTEKIKTKEFDGIPVTQEVGQKAFEFLYNKKWQGKDGKKFTDFDKFILELDKPENHALKVKVGLLAQQNFDLTKVQKKAVSKESSELFKEFATKKTKQTAKKEPAATPWNL